jgi:hypothetical protein
LLVLCACNRATPLVYEEVASHVSISYLKSLCKGALYTITEDVWIEWRVVGNDAYGEFPYSLVIEDQYGGIEVVIDRTELHKEFESGCAVQIYCNGLALADYGGKIQLGAPPTADYTIDRIPERLFSRHLRRTDAPAVDMLPRTIVFGDVRPALITTYVRFDNVAFVREEIGLPLCDRDPETGRTVATDRRLVDVRGDTLLLRTAATCTYADEPIPEGTGSFRGILDYFNGAYQLRPTNREIALEI